jgi:hypothetical protein
MAYGERQLDFDLSLEDLVGAKFEVVLGYHQPAPSSH